MLDIVTSDILKNWIEVGEKTVLMRHVCRLGKTFPDPPPMICELLSDLF